MAGNTITREHLVDAVFHVEREDDARFPRNAARRIVESVFAHMSDALVSGEDVKISGFGTFRLRDKKSRMGRNPKTSELAEVSARRVILFKPSVLLRDKVAEGNRQI